MKIQNNNILLRRILEGDRTTKSGIILPPTSKDSPRYEVVLVGEWTKDFDGIRPEVGDYVQSAEPNPPGLKYKGEQCFMVGGASLLCIEDAQDILDSAPSKLIKPNGKPGKIIEVSN